MKNLQLFTHPVFGDIRTAGTSENPLFCLPDLCRILSLDASQVMKRLEDGVVTIHPTSDRLGRKQQANFVNEDGLYDVILDSRKPEAKAFRKWVTSEVLPAIRQHGAYMTDKVIERTLSDPDYMIEILTKMKDERKAREEAEERNAYLRTVNENQQRQIEESKPKVVFADSILGSKSSILVGQLAKLLTQNGYKIGQNRLFAWLRDNHYLGSYGSYYNIPYQVYVEQGLFEVKVTCHTENEKMVTSSTTKVTGKGQQYFINLFLGK